MTVLSQHISLGVENSTAKNIILAFFGSVFIAISAQISVPMFPVPMTMQTFAVLSIAMTLGARFGALSVIMYLTEGAMGSPVFANGGFGVTALFAPSGGFLFGFVLAAYIVGALAERGYDKTVTKAFIAMMLGNFALYAVGLAQLGAIVGWDKPVLAWGLYPFIIGSLVKTGVAAALFPMLWKKLSK